MGALGILFVGIAQRRTAKFGVGQGLRASKAWNIGLLGIARLGCSHLGSRDYAVGHAAQSRLRSGFALPFIVHIKKRLVFYDGTAERSSELVVVERILVRRRC